MSGIGARRDCRLRHRFPARTPCRASESRPARRPAAAAEGPSRGSGCSRPSRSSSPSGTSRRAPAPGTRSPTGTASAHATWVGLDNFRRSSTTPPSRGALDAHARARLRVRVVVERDRARARARAPPDASRRRGLLRALFFVPVVMSSLAVSYVWQFIFSYTGPLNSLLDALGLESLASAHGRATRPGRSGRSSSSSSGSSSGSRW